LNLVDSLCYRSFCLCISHVILHGACTLCGFILCNNNNPGAYDCLEFSLLEYWLVSACPYSTTEHLPLFGSPPSSSSRLGADECRPVILGIGGICLNASCSPLLTEPENHLALLCDFRRTLVRRLWRLYAPYTHILVNGRTVTPPQTRSGEGMRNRLRPKIC